MAVVSEPVDGSDTYKRGETIEAAVTFGDRVLVDTSLGTPTHSGCWDRPHPNASYVRAGRAPTGWCSNTPSYRDSDTDGISVYANRLALNGGVIASVYGVEALLDV